MNCKEIEEMFVKRFQNNTANLHRRVARYSYLPEISTKDSSINYWFSHEEIGFCPRKMLDSDIPLHSDKANRVLREAIEFLFSISIQNEESYLDGDYHGYIFVADNYLCMSGFKIEFALREDVGFGGPSYIIELPNSEFDFDFTNSTKDYYSRRKSKIAHMFYTRNPYFSLVG